VLRREPVTPATQEAEMRSILIKHQPGQIVCEILSQKKPIQKRADGVAQVVQYLPSKYEDPSSNPSTTKIFF
jgi:hypothetical protein